MLTRQEYSLKTEFGQYLIVYSKIKGVGAEGKSNIPKCWKWYTCEIP